MDFNKVIALVYEARKFVFSKRLLGEVENKNPNDFVTAVDTAISDFIKSGLAALYPQVGFMTEEEDKHCLGGECFILDPIDGTTNLIYDYKMSSISLAYVKQGRVEFGAVFNPFTNELFFALRGKGAHFYDTCGGVDELLALGVENYEVNKLVTASRPMSRALIEFGAGSSYKEMASENFDRARKIFCECLDIRRTCSTALAICYIAAGRMDGYFEKIIKPWDFAAGILVLEEAGGISSDWQGNPLPLDKETTIICATKSVYSGLKAFVE